MALRPCPEWAAKLKLAREALGLSRGRVAGLAGVPSHTLRRWEDGSRRPPEPRLRRLLDALKLTGTEGNDILRDAGYHVEPTLYPNWRFPNYFYTIDEVQRVVEDVPWPEMVLDNNVGLIAANKAMAAVWRVNLEAERRKRSRAQMNLLSVASDHHFADRVMNWEELISVIIGVVKGQPERPESLEQPSAYLNAVLEEFAKGDRVFLERLLDVWASCEPIPAKCRWSYRVVWVDPDFGEMRFHALVSTCSEPAGLAFSDWHPTDAETWQVLEQVKAREQAERNRR